ncbi:MAG: methyltransferase domain-containing protein [Anaerolineae bacterium]|nr:methyltransferase domain-containing protein [Anaerolineae bacterium]
MDIDLYLHVREKEGRLYSDDVVARLPLMPSDNSLADEWRARSASASRLTQYLLRRATPLSILDLGCGNGWFSNLLSKFGHRVLSVDQNRHELKQAARVFSLNPCLFFIETNIFSAPFMAGTFDVIVLASVIQYFHDLPALLKVLLRYLKPKGEIHIMDSPLYSDEELKAAVHRSQQYYSSLGFPEMAGHYFHHNLSDLDAFDSKWLYNPQSHIYRLKRLLGWVDSPFPWIMIRKQDVE